MEKFFEDLYPMLLSFAGVVIPAIGAYIAFLIQKKTGIDIIAAKKAIESGDREAFHKALETAAKLAVEEGLIGQDAIDFMLEYAGISTPEAIEGLNPSRMLAEQLAQSKLIDEKAVKKVEEVKQAVDVIKTADEKVESQGPGGQVSFGDTRDLADKLQRVKERLG